MGQSQGHSQATVEEWTSHGSDCESKGGCCLIKRFGKVVYLESFCDYKWMCVQVCPVHSIVSIKLSVSVSERM